MAHALVSRGFITRDEAQACRSTSDGDAGPERLLKKLVKAGFLTPHQARRAAHDAPP